MPSETTPTYDVLGIGFGPSNLALAIAIEEYNETAVTPLAARFVERRKDFAWHPGMLLPGTTMQVSFFKDLATQRNPRSAYTFVSYLADRGRLADFINLQTFFPLRAEFADYLAWAAERVSVPVDYAVDVRSVEWTGEHFEVIAETGRFRARNLVLGGGIWGKIPPGVQRGPRVFHNHDLLTRLAALPAATRGRYVVVGAGQSGAEVADYLLGHTDSEVHSVLTKYGFTPADDSPFANRIFDATTVDEFYHADQAWKDRLMAYHRGTNYSAVDPELISSLYRQEYTERVSGERRFVLHGASEVVDVTENDDEVVVTVAERLTGKTEVLRADAVIFATGFEPVPVWRILGDLERVCHTDAAGRPLLERSYRLVTDPEVTGSIYLQGNSEHTHGLTSTLLSNVAVRSGEIVDALTTDRAMRCVESSSLPDRVPSERGPAHIG
ncbi:MAG: SidA/IucD/PvdA family monooxygenase [Gordonia sp. (in: high G+C Gram-positive bacteria)]|uniref:lysine N(6)-hydroxylase/L-ornithine N(5)-oxygenase family protein n=1 Tax=Gordonia sp. (in: high G+C Gram-positive bacteria) TaxID=84139 RepID=UPI0039E5C2E4